jgi:hypothetical protein
MQSSPAGRETGAVKKQALKRVKGTSAANGTSARTVN